MFWKHKLTLKFIIFIKNYLTTINSYSGYFCSLKLCNASLTFNTASNRFGIVIINFLHSSGVIESHISWILAFNPLTVRCRSFRSFLFMSAHRFSIGLRSGLGDGQSKTSIPFSCSHFFVVFAAWDDAPSCWNIYSPQSAHFGTDERRFSCNILIYFCAFTIPSMKWSWPTPFEDMHPHTIRLAGNLTVRFKQSLLYASVLLRITLFLASPTHTSNLDSSLKIMVSHCLCTQERFSLTHNKRFFIWSAVSRGFSLALKNKYNEMLFEMQNEC